VVKILQPYLIESNIFCECSVGLHDLISDFLPLPKVVVYCFIFGPALPKKLICCQVSYLRTIKYKVCHVIIYKCWRMCRIYILLNNFDFSLHPLGGGRPFFVVVKKISDISKPYTEILRYCSS
jgi:hypothetical protein